MEIEVELLEFSDDLANVPTLDLQAKITVGRRKKERGNLWVARQEPTFAIQCYR